MKPLVDAAMMNMGAGEEPLPKTFLLHPEFNAAGVITDIVSVHCDSFLAK